MIKRPKVYWRYIGLLHASPNGADRHALLSRPWVESIREGFVIEQTIGELALLGKDFDV
jgi:hypothetical protein